MSIEAMKQALENELSASDFIDKAPQSWDKTERTEWARLQAMYHNIRVFKKALRQAIADFEKQDKFCDNNCVWTDHHKDCVRAEKQEPCGWQYYQDGKWHNGMEINNHRANTEAAGIPVRSVYSQPPQPKREPLACVIDGKLMAYKNGPLPDNCLLYDQAL